MLYYYTMRGETFYPYNLEVYHLDCPSHCFLYSCSSPTPNLNVGEEPRMFLDHLFHPGIQLNFDGGKLECHGKQLL
jgi:hypothetical protein